MHAGLYCVLKNRDIFIVKKNDIAFNYNIFIVCGLIYAIIKTTINRFTR